MKQPLEMLPLLSPAAILFVVSDPAVTRNDHLTQPQALILVTGSYIVAVGLESVLCYYIFRWEEYRRQREVRRAWCGAGAAGIILQ